jgi:phosphopantothenoylcysteine synthetase/decarboxylase
MRILVTAGNTQVMIDRVRCLTNIFTGRTGAGIAGHAQARGHVVTLLTSHPETVAEFGTAPGSDRRAFQAYRTFEDLQSLLSSHVQHGGFDAIIHSAAVSDYLAAGVFSSAPNTQFHNDGHWRTQDGTAPALLDRSADKIKSDETELWLRLVRAPKLIDRVRTEWAFHGVLVKFKLEVGVSAERLLEVAEGSRRQSEADLMVANTLEGAHDWALLGPVEDEYHRVERADLPGRLLDAVERLHKERSRG